MSAFHTNPWIENFVPRPEADIRLFCFSHVGGAASVYRLWPSLLNERVELCAIELPGRGRRLGEELVTSLPELIFQLDISLRGELEKPFAVFGHSMGALIAFEWIRSLRKKGLPLPVLLFLSAFGAPQLSPRPRKILYDLPDLELLRELERLSGTPPEVLKHKELMELLLPVIRADLKMVETYQYEPGELLSVPLRVLGGSVDAEVEKSRLLAWQELSDGNFKARFFEGDHFFIHHKREEVLRFVSEEIEGVFL